VISLHPLSNTGRVPSIRGQRAISQGIAIIAVILIVIAGLGGFFVGVKSGGSVSGQPQIETTTVNSTISAVRLVTSTVTSSITVAGTSYEINLKTENNSITNLVVSKIDLPQYPLSMAVNSKADLVYVTDWYVNTTLFVINGSTNKIVASIPLNSTLPYDPIVNSVTGNVYIGNLVINGSTNKVIARISKNMTFVAVDQSNDLVYAKLTENLQNGNAEIFELNGPDNVVLQSLTYTGLVFGDVRINTGTHTLYTAACNYYYCNPEFILAINGSTLAIESQIPVPDRVITLYVNTLTNMIYATALQNSLLVINGSDNQLSATIPITPFANELFGLSADPESYLIMVTGAPICTGFSGCDINTLYVMSSLNYGLFSSFQTNGTLSGPVLVAFNPANNETYLSFEYSSYVLAIKVPDYQITVVGP
jgi:hypothetical protein